MITRDGQIVRFGLDVYQEKGIYLTAAVSIYGFLDGVGDVRKDDRLFMCGYAGWGTAQEDGPLDQFVKRWGAATADVGPIHATELFSASGPFLGWDDRRVDRLAGELIDAIRFTMPIGLAVGFDNKYYLSLSSGQQRIIGDPLLICMCRTLDLAVQFIGEMRARGDLIAGINLTFDDADTARAKGRKPDAVVMLSTWLTAKRARPDLVDYVASIGFADDRRFFPLQAADLLCNLTHRFWQAELIKRRPSSDRTERHLRTLLTSDPAAPFAYRIDFVTAQEMNDGVRLGQRLYFKNWRDVNF